MLLTADRSVRERCRLQDDVHSVTVPEVNSVRQTGSPLLQVEREGTILKLAYAGKYGGKITRNRQDQPNIWVCVLTYVEVLRQRYVEVPQRVRLSTTKSKPNNVFSDLTHEQTHTQCCT